MKQNTQIKHIALSVASSTQRADPVAIVDIMQPLPSQISHCCRPRATHGPSFAGAGMARSRAIWPIPTHRRAVVLAAHSRRRKQQPSSNILHQANPAAVEEPHRVAGLKQGASPTRTVYVGGKLLLQTFLDAPSNQLKLSFQLVSATVAGTQLLTQFLQFPVRWAHFACGAQLADACAVVQEVTDAG